MLFGYPRSAIKFNWLHAAVYCMLRDIHASVRRGNPAPTWPQSIPVPFRDRLRSRRGLRNRLHNYAQQFHALSGAEQDTVCEALWSQNRIRALLAGASSCPRASDLPAAIQEIVIDLFEYCFNLLVELDIRDEYYQIIYYRLPSKLCPFCGIEYFDSPEAPREDLDHYLVRETYPFAAANLRNLVPMGGRCNSSYKGRQDMIWDGAHRRKAAYPYGCTEIKVSLCRSRPFGGNQSQLPQWQIDLVPNSEEASTWNDVFRIRERYERDVLDEYYNSWLDEFAKWCRSAQLSPASNAELVASLERYHQYQSDCGFSDRAFLKAAVLEMLIQHCRSGNQRLIKLLTDITQIYT